MCDTTFALLLAVLSTVLNGVIPQDIMKRVGMMVEMLPDSVDVNAILIKEMKPMALMSCMHKCLSADECQYVVFCAVTAVCLLYQASVLAGHVMFLPHGCKRLYRKDRKHEIQSGNAALKQPCYQSSTVFGGVCQRAIDGNPNPTWTGGSCTHTAPEATNPWWRVDLGHPHVVINVTIVNRDELSSRLNNYDIRVGNSLTENGNKNEICVSGIQHEPTITRTFKCVPSRVGRYVNIQIISWAATLTLCEVIVGGFRPE